MEALLEPVESCLAAGGLVLASSDRLARALAASVHRARQLAGLRAWPAPAILTFSAFHRIEWERRTAAASLVLNPLQEESLWDQVAARELSLATVLAASRQRLGSLAMEAHRLLALYAPAALAAPARRSWSDDAAVFSRWLEAFDRLLAENHLLPSARLILELTAALERDSAPRPPLLIAGFDRLAPSEQALLAAWGPWQELPSPAPSAAPLHRLAADPGAELEACAAWCASTLAQAPHSRLMILTQDAAARRGAIERALLSASRLTGQPLAFEFSLGVALGSLPLIRAALLLLGWLAAPLDEPQLDWLLASGLSAAAEDESQALRAHALALRSRGLQRTRWSLEAFLHTHAGPSQPPASWLERLSSARQHLQDHALRPQSPLHWSGILPGLLDRLAFAQSRPLSSPEFQALDSFRQLVETCGSLGFDGRRVHFSEFLTSIEQAAAASLFVPESSGASILVTGPAESAGLHADALWFLGVHEASWPPPGRPHPLLPLALQRQASMPHSTPQLDRDLAQRQTARLLASAAQVHFSFPGQDSTGELRPSRLLVELAGPPQPLPASLPAAPQPLTQEVSDRSRIPFAPGPIRGGAAVLSDQSQCPFRAFARARLGLRSFEPAQPCLTASQRGSLLHSVMHSIWAGPPDGLRSHADLVALSDLKSFVASHVRRVFPAVLPQGQSQALPARYLELEQERLVRLLSEWLAYESSRIAFAVEATEQQRAVSIAGLSLDLRLDRLDRLADGSVLVLDYKTGVVSARDWDPPRPRDVQLPLYAGFALDRETEPLGGLLFAQIVAGEKLGFAGRMGQAAETLLPGLAPRNALLASPLDGVMLDGWRAEIESLARDFLAGEAAVNPARFPQTCEFCGLEALCRIREQQLQTSPDDDESDLEAADV